MKDFKKELLRLLHEEKQQNKKNDISNTFAKVFLILGFATAIITTALCVYSYIDNRMYRKKWEEYDDCGI